MEIVRAFAPATVGNVICGFDVLGLALRAPGDEVIVRRSGDAGVTITSIHGDGGRLPLDAGENVAGVAASAVIAVSGGPQGIELELWKGLPIASGMGGSAASAVAAAVATDALLGSRLDRPALLACALEGERVAAGAGHADNAAPCLYGGIALCRHGDPVDVVALPVPAGLSVALVRPPHEILTEQGRSVLPERLPLGAVVAQMADVSAFVSALHSGDMDLLGRALSDRIAEPVRRSLVPGFDSVRAAALAAGALGAGISGAGPSMFALCRSLADTRSVADAMAEAFAGAGVEGADRHVSEVAMEGARILSDTEPVQ
ncbi:MAG: homoserine kinase [Gemmatimonadota bacterium]|nr:MAG: homoserine kinase [Gemmatimonadota bacterium]